MNLKSFEDAFRPLVGTCHATCACGREFYDGGDRKGWDWEEGELDRIDNDPNATELDYSVTFVRFEGDDYVSDCGCWHKRAEQIMGFIDSHAHQIADYLNAEKKRQLAEAEAMPEVS